MTPVTKNLYISKEKKYYIIYNIKIKLDTFMFALDI